MYFIVNKVILFLFSSGTVGLIAEWRSVFDTDADHSILIPYVILRSFREKSHLALQILKAVWRNNRCFISDSYKVQTYTLGAGHSVFERQTWRCIQ
jgi:hypothetical protein